MKLSVLLIFTAFLNTLSFSQNDRIYYDENWIEIKSSEKAFYYREIVETNKDGVVEVNDFYINGNIQMNGFYSDLESEVKHGHFTFYYKNGNVSYHGDYDKGAKVGKWVEFYESSQKKEEGNYEMMIDSTTKYFPINYWNKLGEQTLIEGNGTYYQNLSSFEDSVKQSGPMVNHKKEGVWKGEYKKSGYRFEETYKNDSLISGTTTDINGKEYNYDLITVYPRHKKDMYKLISENFMYPQALIDSGVQGIVFIKLTIEKDGNVSDIKLIKGPHETLNKEAIRVTKLLKEWIPGKCRGVLTRMSFFLPIRLKIK